MSGLKLERMESMRAFLALAVLVSWCCEQARSDPPTQKMKPVIVWSDIDSHITEPRFLCLRSADEWAKIWRLHKGRAPDDSLCPPPPEIDFSSYMVVALFNGSYSQDLGLTIDRVDDQKDVIRLRYERNVYSVAGRPIRTKTYDYAFVVLPKSKKPVLIEEKVLGETRESAVSWRERAHLEPK
jgi:hypothetical protein